MERREGLDVTMAVNAQIKAIIKNSETKQHHENV